MDMSRFFVSDGMWGRISGILPGKATDRGVTPSDTRLFLEAVLWRVRTGSPWRDLPSELGNWNSAFRRFRRWARAGVFDRLFEHVSGDPDMEYALIDRTTVSVHQKATGAKGGLKNKAIGRSKGGLTTKIMALVNALGNLVRFVLMPGQRKDIMGVRPPIGGVTFDALLADKAFDADWLRLELDTRGALSVIPPRKNRKQLIQIDAERHKWRHLVENYFAKIKEFRRIAIRYAKLMKASAPISISLPRLSHVANCPQTLEAAGLAGIAALCRNDNGGASLRLHPPFSG